MDSPSAVVGHDQQRDRSWRGCRLSSRHASRSFRPTWGWAVLSLSVGKFLARRSEIEFQLAGRSGQGILLRILVELAQQADQVFLPVLGDREDKILLFLEFFPAEELVDSSILSKTSFCRSADGLAFGDLFILAQLLGNFARRLEVALGFADRLDGLVLEDDAVDTAPPAGYW